MTGPLILLAIGAIIAVWAFLAGDASRRKRELERQKRAERERVEACGQVVLDFANHLGYIARQAISRDELATLIDAGLGPEELAGEIHDRIDEIPGLTLGYHSFGEVRIPVRLPDNLRDRHIYVVGKSGSGKTNLLRTMIFQDLEEGAGLGVIAPEQEMLTEEILPYIPDHRIDDVIYFNPADTDRPVPFNPLYLEPGEDRDLKVDEVLTVFKRLMGDTGPRMEELLRQSLYVLVGRKDATLVDVVRLLDRTDSSFRDEVIRTCRDREAARFWSQVYPTFPKDAHLPITNRLGRLLHPRSIRSVLCQPGRSLSFQQAMDEGKILLFNLSDGILGEQNSQILGQLIVSQFQLAVMARAAQSKFSRVPYKLFIDEFQTFVGTAAVSYEKILSRARKYRLALTISHQQTGQIPGQLLKEILGNVSTAVCFAVSREDARRFSREFVTEYNGEVVTVPEEEILRLRTGEAWCKIGQHAFPMRTYLADQHPDYDRARMIIERARQNYGVEPAQGWGREMKDPLAGVLDDLDPGNLFGE